MMDGFNLLISIIGRVFGLLDLPILGVPMYVYFMAVFLLGMLAKFIHGRK